MYSTLPRWMRATVMGKDVKVIDNTENSDESVDHPSHYNKGKVEVITAIEDWGLDFNSGNVVKYAARAGLKPGSDRLEDLKKCAWYAQRAVEHEEKRQKDDVG